MVSLALLPYLPPYLWFILAFMIRLLQGFSGALLGSSSYSITSAAYLRDVEGILSLTHIVSGVGIILGPLTGALLYSIGGFSYVYGTYALMLVSIAVLSLFSVPSCGKAGPTDPSPAAMTPLKDVLACPGVLTTCLAVGCGVFAYNFFQPTLAEHVLAFGISIPNAALMFAVPPFAYAVWAGIISKLPRAIDSKATILSGLLCASIALCIVCPVYFLPQNLYVISFGLVLLGVSLAATISPVLPEMLNSTQKQLSQHAPEQVTDTVSGLISSCFFLGEILAPPVAGLLTDCLAFTPAALVISAVLFLFTVFYCLKGGFKALKTCARRYWRKPSEPFLGQDATDRSVGSIVELVP
jgi:MFS family permease